MNKIKLVIDTDVVFASSYRSGAIESISCSNFLGVVLEKNDYSITMSDELKEEWGKHIVGRSDTSYWVTWWTEMESQDRVEYLGIVEDKQLQLLLERNSNNEGEAKKMIKDAHLLEAALLTDKRVVSKNNTERLKFKRVSSNINEIQDIVWVDPSSDEEKPIEWLEDGAPADDFRKLGYQPKK